jgi:undecaprenyl diphosphate synthase
VLTLYAFSADNWRRPSDEVEALLGLFQRYLRDTLERLRSAGVRLTVIGRRDRLGPMLRAAVTTAEMATAAGSRLWLRLAIDYSSRDALRQAAALLPAGRVVSREAFAAALARGIGDPVGAPDVDLLIRTGGEQRLSDFLLWESAYAELLFLPVLWPDFDPAALRAAIDAFGGRQRRFGALPGRPRVSTDREAAFG